MQTLTFNITINAPTEKVWKTMLEDQTYREWTKAFHDGSFYEGSWDEGSEIHFLMVDESGKKQGMYSRIKSNVKYQFISIEHLGGIKDGEIDTTSEEVKQWSPAFENYTFTSRGNQTEVKVEMQTSEKYADTFNDMWPRALQSLKELSER